MPLERVFLALACLVWLICHPTLIFAANSEIMPLAAQSLLLDGQVTGGGVVVVGERGHVLLSEDQGRTWEQQEVPTRATLTSVFFVDTANGWAAGHDGVILMTQDGGRHWEQVHADPEDGRPILDLWFHDQEQGYAVGAYGLFLMTEDGGKNWESVDFNPAPLVVDKLPASVENDEEIWVDFHLNQIAATPTGRIYVAAESGNLYRSEEGGRSWSSLPTPYEGSFYGSLSLGQESLLAYGLRGHLFRTEDAGVTWQEIPTGVQATLTDGVNLQDGRIVFAGLAGTMLISEDQGYSFTSQTQDNRAGISKIIQAQDGALILIGEDGVKRLTLPVAEKEQGR